MGGQNVPVASFYIDSFNLYNGILKGTPYKWLDLARLCQTLAPASQVGPIHYFTARVHGAAARRQQVYLDALKSIPVVVHTEGHFAVNTVCRELAVVPERRMAASLEYLDGNGAWQPLPHPRPGRPVRASVRDPKEKGTDVNLATVLLVDAFAGQVNEAYVVSGDSDLQMPVAVAAGRIPVTVVNPVPGRRSRELQASATAYTTLQLGMLAACQLGNRVVVAGRAIHKPATW